MLVLAACAPSAPSADELSAGELLVQALPESLSPGQQVTVSLAEVFTEPAWDTFAIVCPYETPADVAADLGIPSTGVPDLARTDQYQAVLLLNDGALAQASQFPRGTLDLCGNQAEERVTLSVNDGLVFSRGEEDNWTLLPPGQSDS